LRGPIGARKAPILVFKHDNRTSLDCDSVLPLLDCDSVLPLLDCGSTLSLLIGLRRVTAKRRRAAASHSLDCGSVLPLLDCGSTLPLLATACGA